METRRGRNDGPDIDAAVESYRKSARVGKAGGVIGVRRLLQAARRLFNWAIRYHQATSTTLWREGVTLISVKPGKARKRRLVGDEEDRLIAAADRDTKHLMIAQLETGCPPGEIRTLQWSEVRDNNDRDSRRKGM
jgi:integrase